MGINDSKTEIWTVDQLVRGINDPQAPMKVEIPKFQRSVVWGEKQRQALIESIFRGYPFGSLLLYKKPGGNKDVYQVVDGLQRTSTLVRYQDAPLAYVTNELLHEETVSKLAQLLGVDKDDATEAILDAFKAVGKATNANTIKIAKMLCSSVGALEAGDEVLDLTADLLDSLAQESDISKSSIPVIVYSGDAADLPEIFERVNQQGTKLSKYELLASAWLESPTMVSDPLVRDAINNKYKVLIDKGFTIDGLTKEDTVPSINLFEYLFGLGKVLTVKFPTLFKGSKGDDADAETEPVGFSLVATVVGSSMSQLRKLDLKLRQADGWIDPSAMQKAIEGACEFVAKTLQPYVGLKLNSTGSITEIAHSEMQIVSLVARAVVGRWDPEAGWAEREGWKADWEKLEVAIPQHYVADILADHWRGPLYTYLFERVWDDSGNPASHYAKPISLVDFTQRLDLWFERQISREQSSRSYVRSSERLFLRCVYTGLVSHLHDNQVVFELEHLFPVSRLVAIIEDEGGPGWPISCIANLALFTQTLNREKSAKTIGEYVIDPGLDAETQSMLDKYLLCDVEAVQIGEDFGVDEYKQFLRHRWQTLRGRATENLKVT